MKKLTLLLLLFIAFGMGYAFSEITAQHKKAEPRKVTGIGGVFFKSRNPDKLRAWYAQNLGMKAEKYGVNFEWRQATDSTKKGSTQWTVFSMRSTYFDPSMKEFMINYRVENLTDLYTQLRKDSVVILDTVLATDYGKFLHIMDIESNKIELWEPKD